MGSGSHWAVLRYPVAIIGGRRDVAVDVCDPAPVAFIVVIHREGWLDAIGDRGAIAAGTTSKLEEEG